MTHTEIHNGMDVIDSRDIIARIEELEGLRDDAETAATEHNEALEELEKELRETATNEATEEEISAIHERIEDHGPKQEKVFGKDGERQYFASDDFQDEEEEELFQLLALQEDASGSPDWKYGEGLIKDTYFQEYAEQLAEDIGAIQKNATWPNNHIDWDAAADALKQDYMRVDFAGEDYWIRA